MAPTKTDEKPKTDPYLRQMVAALLTGVHAQKGTTYLTQENINRMVRQAKMVVEEVKRQEQE